MDDVRLEAIDRAGDRRVVGGGDPDVGIEGKANVRQGRQLVLEPGAGAVIGERVGCARRVSRGDDADLPAAGAQPGDGKRGDDGDAVDLRRLGVRAEENAWRIRLRHDSLECGVERFSAGTVTA